MCSTIGSGKLVGVRQDDPHKNLPVPIVVDEVPIKVHRLTSAISMTTAEREKAELKKATEIRTRIKLAKHISYCNDANPGMDPAFAFNAGAREFIANALIPGPPI